jgi:hypothetical protein
MYLGFGITVLGGGNCIGNILGILINSYLIFIRIEYLTIVFSSMVGFLSFAGEKNIIFIILSFFRVDGILN